MSKVKLLCGKLLCKNQVDAKCIHLHLLCLVVIQYRSVYCISGIVVITDLASIINHLGCGIFLAAGVNERVNEASQLQIVCGRML